MSAIPINIKIERGTDFSKVFTLEDEYKNPIDLTSYSVSAFFSHSYVSSAKHIFTSSIIDPLNGKIKISLTSAQTSLLKLPRYVYDIVITSPINLGGVKSRVYEGVMEISPGVTYYTGSDGSSPKVPLSLEQIINVDTDGIENNYVLMFDSQTQTYKFVHPSEVLDRADGVDDDSLNYGTY